MKYRIVTNGYKFKAQERWLGFWRTARRDNDGGKLPEYNTREEVEEILKVWESQAKIDTSPWRPV
jgi:hypothetical protein